MFDARRDKDVIGILEDIAEESMERTNFFHSGAEPTLYSLHHEEESVLTQSRRTSDR